MSRTRVIIMGAAGRDFHNFNCVYRDDPGTEVVAFTATQIPDIEGRTYPATLAGPLYPRGIPIFPEEDLPRLIKERQVREVIFAYSDVSHQYVMNRASMVLATGADFRLLGPDRTMLSSSRPVVSIGAVRTGAGKSPTTRRVAEILAGFGYKVVVVRHPMPYGDLSRQVAQRFATHEDLDRHDCTIEEREEYEPHLDRGRVVYAGIDYAEILRQAESEAEVILWDGGNNDLPFFRPLVHIVVVDPHRPGHEVSYHPGEANLRLANVVVISKIDSAPPEGVATVRENVRRLNPDAVVVEAATPYFVDDPDQIRGRKVLVIEDGPTATHGDMAYGAGVLAARKFGAKSLIDPRPVAVGSIRDTFARYPHIGPLLPAMGYGARQVAELEATINASEAELVVVATPIDLRRLIKLEIPAVRVRYEMQEIGQPTLQTVLQQALGGKARP